MAAKSRSTLRLQACMQALETQHAQQMDVRLLSAHLSTPSAVAVQTSMTAVRSGAMSPRRAASAAACTAGSAAAACRTCCACCACPPLGCPRAAAGASPVAPKPRLRGASGSHPGSAIWEASGERQCTACQGATASTAQLLTRCPSGTGLQPPQGGEPAPGVTCSQAPPERGQSTSRRCSGLHSLSYRSRSRHSRPCNGVQ